MLPLMRSMKAESAGLASLLTRVEEKVAVMSGDLTVVVNEVAHWKKILSESMPKMGVSLDGVHGEILSLKNTVKSVELSVKGLNQKYVVVERNLAELEKWSVGFEFDKKFLGNDVNILDKYVNCDPKASQSCSVPSAANSSPLVTSGSTPSPLEVCAVTSVVDMLAPHTFNPSLTPALSIEEFESLMKSLV